MSLSFFADLSSNGRRRPTASPSFFLGKSIGGSSSFILAGGTSILLTSIEWVSHAGNRAALTRLDACLHQRRADADPIRCAYSLWCRIGRNCGSTRASRAKPRLLFLS